MSSGHTEEELCFLFKKQVLDNDAAIFCECCKYWHHTKCLNMLKDVYDFLSKTADTRIHWYGKKMRSGVARLCDQLVNINMRQDIKDKRVEEI